MSITDYSKLNPLILKIYEAAFQPELWQQITLEVSDLMKSGATQLLVLDNTTKTEIIATSSRLCPEGQQKYITEYAPIDLRVPRLLKCNIGSLIQEHTILNEVEKKNNKSVTRFLQSYELDNLTGSNLSIGTSWVWFGVARKGDGNIYTKDELALFQILIPHIRKALRLHQSIQAINSHSSGLADLFSYTGKATIFFNGNGEVCFINGFAEKLLNKNLFGIGNKRFHFKNSETQKRFETALGSILGYPEHFFHTTQDTFIARDQEENEYGIRLVPHLGDLHEVSYSECARALLLISRLNDPRNISLKEIDRFGVLFNLTDAEKRVVGAVANLKNITQFALDIGLKPDSVRKQLKSAMAKTGVRSQQELIRRLERFCFVQLR